MSGPAHVARRPGQDSGAQGRVREAYDRLRDGRARAEASLDVWWPPPDPVEAFDQAARREAVEPGWSEALSALVRLAFDPGER